MGPMLAVELDLGTQVPLGALGVVLVAVLKMMFSMQGDQRQAELTLRSEWAKSDARYQARIDEMQRRLDEQQDQINQLISGASPRRRGGTPTASST